MMNHALLVLNFLIIFFFITSPSRSEAGTFEILDEAIWKLSYTISIENSALKTREVELIIPLIPSDNPSQEVISKHLPSKPVRIKRDNYENSLGVFRVEIGPQERKSLTFSYKIRTRHVRWQGESETCYTNLSKNNNELIEPQPLIESSNRAVRNAAQKVAGRERHPYYKALALYDYILSQYSFNPHSGLYGASEALGKKTIQCGDAALLYIALLRASDIPSMFVGGLFVTPGKSEYHEYHAWAEIMLPGYSKAAVDPTLGRFDPGHRLRCFLERRAEYITLWKGTTKPYVIHHLNEKEKSSKVTFLIKVNQLSCLKNATHMKEFQKIDVSYRTFKKLPGNCFRSSFSSSSLEHYRTGKKFEAENLLDKAVEEYFTALRISPGYLEPVKALLKIYDDQSKKMIIYNEFKKKVEISPRDPLALYALGELERRLNSYSASSNAFDRAAACGFICEELYLSRLYLYSRTKETGSFEEAFRSCLALNCSNFEAYKRTLLFYQDLEMWDHCLYWAFKGRTEFPESGIFPAMEGFAYLQKEDLRKARQSIDEAISKDPEIGWYHCVLGWILLKQGDRNGAKKEIDKGISLGRGVMNPQFFESLIKTPGK